MIKFPITTNWYKKAAELETTSSDISAGVDEGSIYKVPYTKILDIQSHPGADRLEIATVYGFQVIVRKFEYSIGTEVFYIPIDAIITPELEAHIFGPDSKIKLNKFRVRQIKLRGVASQGMLLSKKDVETYLKSQSIWAVGNFKLEEDYAKLLNIKKYDPPEIINPDTRQKKSRNNKGENVLFHSYNGVQNIKWYPLLFKEDEEVIIQCKLHGSNLRASVLPNKPDTFWKKILSLFGSLPGEEYLYGSNRVQISRKSSYKGYYSEDIYGAAVKKFNVFEKLKRGETAYFELIGPGIQKNYDYGHKEHHIVLFDVKVLNEETGTQTWLNPEEVEAFAKERGLDFVPVLYRGMWNKELAYTLTKGPSVYCPEQKVREGIVIKSRYGYNDETCSSSKRALKWINEDYLSNADNTDFH